MGKKENNMPP